MLGPITRFDATNFPCNAAAELSDELFNVRKCVPKSHRKATKVMARDIELAVGAALAAVNDAGLTTRGTDADADPTIDPDRFGCQIGAGLIAADTDELTAAMAQSRLQSDGETLGGFDLKDWGGNGMQHLTPLWLLKYLPNMLACHVTIIHDCRGPSNTLTCAEASSALSLGESLRVIQRGQADACLTGGAEYKANHMGLLRQHFANRLATIEKGTDPKTVVKPFDKNACGSILGEGGGILVLEARETAERRGVDADSIYAEVAGFASSQSPCTDTVGLEYDDDDDSLAVAIHNALDEAEVEREAIDAIVPLGLAVPSSDEAERRAVHAVFGIRASDIPIVTTIPNVGQCAAGCGAINLAVAAKMLKEQMIPARLNTTDAGNLNANAASATKAKLRNILITTTSMGGQNAAVVLSK